MNGDAADGSRTSSGVTYTLYAEEALGIDRIHPTGGPTSGATLLHAYLTNALLLEHLRRDPQTTKSLWCRFAYNQTVGEFAHARSELRENRTKAELVECAGKRACGAGAAAIRCATPEYTGPVSGGVGDVTVELSLNGQQFTESGKMFRFYDSSVCELEGFAPQGGPLVGGSTVTLSGACIQHLGDPRCRFGVLNAEVNATLAVSGGGGGASGGGGGRVSARCVAPPHWRQEAGRQSVELQLTLNGQDYLSTSDALGEGTFAYYALGRENLGVEVREIWPTGGPSGGGTLVRVLGYGFSDLGGLLCAFEGSGAVAASRVSDGELVCASPAVSLSGGFEDRELRVSINGELGAPFTTDPLSFTYHRPGSLQVSRVYPRGGPTAGGTMVTLWGVGFSEMGHGSGLSCRFGGSDAPLMPATLSSGYAGGEGPQQLTCESSKAFSLSTHTVAVHVTNNGNNPAGPALSSDTGVAYTFY